MEEQAFLGIESNRVVLSIFDCQYNKDALPTVTAVSTWHVSYSGYSVGNNPRTLQSRRKELTSAIDDVIRQAEDSMRRRIKAVTVVVPAPFTRMHMGVQRQMDPGKGEFIIEQRVIDGMYDAFEERVLRVAGNEYVMQPTTTKNRTWVDKQEQLVSVIGMTCKTLAVSFTAILVRTDFCELLESILNEFKIKIRSFEPCVQSEAMYSIPDELSAYGRVFLVNVGDDHTDVTMLYKNDILTTLVLPFGIKSLTHYIAVEYQTAASTAYSLINDTSMTEKFTGNEAPIIIQQRGNNTTKAKYDHVQALCQYHVHKELCDPLLHYFDDYKYLVSEFIGLYPIDDDYDDYADENPAIYLTGTDLYVIPDMPAFVCDTLGVDVAVSDEYSENKNEPDFTYMHSAAKRYFMLSHKPKSVLSSWLSSMFG